MDSERGLSERLAGRIRRAGLGDVSAALLEAAGPLTFVAAQLAFIAEPLFGGRRGAIGELGRLFEDPSRLSELLVRLRQEDAE
jgi:hypothetical protein